MDHFQYLLLMACCLALSAPLELLGARVYRQPARLARAVRPVAAVFVAWDAIATAAMVWTYNPKYVTGLLLPFRIPVEELVFFLVVPVCASSRTVACRRCSDGGRAGDRTRLHRARDRRDARGLRVGADLLAYRPVPAPGVLADDADFLFGFALATAALLLWDRQKSQDRSAKDVFSDQPLEGTETR